MISQLITLPTAVELKVARPVTYLVNRKLSVAYEHNQVRFFHPKAIENTRNSHLIIPLS